MAINEIRQQARRSAAERVARLRQQRADMVRQQQEEWSAVVMTALAERDALVDDAERRAGAGLKELVASGLSVAEAARWCDLVEKEAARLVKRAAGGPGLSRTVRGEQ